jgi:Leucine-rich repeat (LRR) protein
LFGTFGTFALVKCFLLLAGFFGTLTISNIFAAGGELNSGNIVTEYGCAIDATNCYLKGLGITRIAADTFVNHTGLSHLYLSENKISELPTGIFDSLTGLTYLSLGYNQISELPTGIFDSLTGLTTLEL